MTTEDSPLRIALSLSVLLIFAAGACDAIIDSDENIARLVPYEEGSRWTYTTSGGYAVMQVLGEVQRGHDTYYKFAFGDSTSADTLYAQNRRGGMLWGAEGPSGVQGVFHFRYPIQDDTTYRYTSPDGEALNVKVWSEVRSVPAGVYEARAYQVNYGNRTDGDIYFFAPGTGLIEIASSRGNGYVLTEYDGD